MASVRWAEPNLFDHVYHGRRDLGADDLDSGVFFVRPKHWPFPIVGATDLSPHNERITCCSDRLDCATSINRPQRFSSARSSSPAGPVQQ